MAAAGEGWIHTKSISLDSTSSRYVGHNTFKIEISVIYGNPSTPQNVRLLILEYVP